MSYQILSLKWRPLSFDQIIGQTHITQTLLNAISMDRLAQAFLFSGPRGVGKTTTARVLASTINEITDYSRCLDIIELDGASNRGIDEIREIRESVKFPPASVKYKVYIIDEAHMLTDQAFNALLKTLEEPPPNIIFILATTDPQKMPQTILSRTQRYDFARISVNTINERLQFILNEEKIEFDKNALELISQKADGSMRDALSILDQVIAFSNNSVNVKSIREAIGIVNDDDLYNLFSDIINNDINNSLSTFNEIINSGISPTVFLENFSSFLNSCMLIKINKNNSNVFLSDDLKDKIEKENSINYVDCLKMLNMALNLSARIKLINNPKISLEVLIAKFISMNTPNVKSISKMDKDEIPKKKISPPEEEIVSSDSNQEAKKEEEKIVSSDSNQEPKEEDLSPSNSISIDIINSSWMEIVSKLDNKNSKLSSFIEESKPSEIKNNKLVLVIDNGNAFVKKVLETDKQIIIDTIKDVCGFTIDIEIMLIDLKESAETKSIEKEDEKEHPLLDDAIKMFNGKIIS